MLIVKEGAAHGLKSRSRVNGYLHKGWPLLVPVFFLVVFFLLPLGQMLLYGFYKYDPIKLVVHELTLSNYRSIVLDPFIRQIFFRTLRLAGITTILCVAFGFLIAYRMLQARGAEKMLLTLVILSPLMISPIVIGYAWMVILAPNTGLVRSVFIMLKMNPVRIMYTETGIVIGLTYVSMVFMVLALHSALENIDRSLVRAAQVLGARPHQVFFRIILPLSLPGLVSGSLLIFAESASSFLMPYILGGRQTPVLATFAYDLASADLNWPAASAIGLALGVVTTIATVCYTTWHRSLERRLGIREF